MKRIGLMFFLFLLCVPYIARAADYCTNPDEYTVDKRCYVNRKVTQLPYRSVVLLNNKGVCTGTIVKRQGLTQNDVGYFVYTAKHCVDSDADGVSVSRIKIKTQDYKNFNAELVKDGTLYENSDIGDWAVYKIEPDMQMDVLAEKIGDNFTSVSFFGGKRKNDVHLVGYGVLKIMSDEEIKEFQSNYENYLMHYANAEKDLSGNILKNQNNGFSESGGIHRYNDDYVMQNFITNNLYYFSEYGVETLKESICDMNKDGMYLGCQSWGGNSGCGVFDSDGRLIGIHIEGIGDIGGENHAKAYKAVMLKRGIGWVRFVESEK